MSFLAIGERATRHVTVTQPSAETRLGALSYTSTVLDMSREADRSEDGRMKRGKERGRQTETERNQEPSVRFHGHEQRCACACKCIVVTATGSHSP